MNRTGLNTNDFWVFVQEQAKVRTTQLHPIVAPQTEVEVVAAAAASPNTPTPIVQQSRPPTATTNPLAAINLGMDSKRFELINGKIVEHTLDDVTRDLTHHTNQLVENFTRPRKLGYLKVAGGFYRPRDEQNVRCADIAFISYDRTQPVIKKGFAPFMPDLAILIRTPEMAHMEVAERGMFFLKNGTQLVWILHPLTRTVDVCTRSPRKSFRVFRVTTGGALMGNDVLPGLSIDLRELFR